MGVVYELTHMTEQHKTYTGSTINIYNRAKAHRKNCYNKKCKKYKFPVYEYIRANGGIDNWDLTIIYEGSDYLQKEKEHIIDTWENNLNIVIPLQTETEKKLINSSKCKAYYKTKSKRSINLKNVLIPQ